MRRTIPRLLLTTLLCLAILLPATSAFSETRRTANIAMDLEREPAMWTITKDAFYGGVLGTLLALGGLLVSDFEMPPEAFGYAAGAGIFIGTGVGIWEVVTRDSLVVGRADVPPEMALPRAAQLRIPLLRF